MAERSVLVLDSGIGGLPYVAAARPLLPQCRFVYAADHAAFPYGEKPPRELSAHLLELVGRIIERENPAAVLLACNTASVVALDALRRAYATPFVGVVPAVKPAAASSRSRRIGVLATTRTVEARYLEDLVGRFAGDAVVTSVAAGEIVRLVETCFGDPPPERVAAAVGPAVARLRDARADTVVLGCTHFVFLLPQLRELFGAEVTVIDSRDGVARRLQHVVEQVEHVADASSGAGESDRFYTTGVTGKRLESLARRFGFAEVCRL